MKGIKKWVFGFCRGLCTGFLYFPAGSACPEIGRQADNPVARRERLENELQAMRKEMRANGWDFQIGANPAMQYSHRAVVQFQARIETA